MENSLAIVLITYNRLDCLKRLYNRLCECEYESSVDLIISIDNSGTSILEDYAKGLIWPYGNLHIKTYKKNLGLRKHILTCGSYTNEYAAIIVFEDDVYPSKYFFDYCIKSINFYKDDERIAGISLYQHKWNTNCNLSFSPDIDPNSDNYFMQFAQSWGQIWTNDQWASFYSWYQENNEEFGYNDYVPDSVTNFPKSSWLKYYIKYTIETDKFFVYPNIALTTNFSDAGTHNKSSSNHYQVPLLNQKKKEYTFSSLNSSNVKYDAFHERIGLGELLGVSDNDLCVDLYGCKANRQNKKYWLSLEQSNFHVVKKFGLSLKPIESNIINNIEGNDIFLYDTTIIENKKIKRENINVKRLFYSNRDIKIKQLYTMTITLSIDKAKIIIRRFLDKFK